MIRKRFEVFSPLTEFVNGLFYIPALQRLCSLRRAAFSRHAAFFGIFPPDLAFRQRRQAGIIRAGSNPGPPPENGSDESEKAALSGKGSADGLPASKRKRSLRRLRRAGRNVPDLRAFRYGNDAGLSSGGRAGDRSDAPGFRLRSDLRPLCRRGWPDAGNEHHAFSRSEGPRRIPAEMAGRQSAVPAAEPGHAENLRFRAGLGKRPGGFDDRRISAGPSGRAPL